MDRYALGGRYVWMGREHGKCGQVVWVKWEQKSVGWACTIHAHRFPPRWNKDGGLSPSLCVSGSLAL